MPDPWIPTDEKEFRELAVTQGWTKTALAEHYGVGRDTIRAAMRKLGITKPADATWPGAAKGFAQPRHGLRADTQGLSEMRDALLRDIASDTKQRKAKAARPARGSDDELHAFEPDLFDVHVGKYAWAEETGEDYDSEEAEARAMAASDDLFAQAAAYKIEQVILPIGNDLLHYDNLEGSTTAGTMQDRDTRFQRMFRRARGLMSWLIAKSAERAFVRAVIVPGNHDSLMAWTLGQVLEAEYHNDPRVTFEDSPKPRKYVLYGKNLIGYAHGHTEPHRQLPQIMAAEVPDLWAASTVREFHLGHFHKSKVTQPVYVDDHQGCTVRVIRSLSGTDAWHARQGYVGGVRGAEAFIWRKSGGLRANLFYTMPR